MRKLWEVLKIIRKIIKILFILMMIYQVTIIIRKYLVSNTTIRIYFTNDNKLIKMAVILEPLIDIKRYDELNYDFNYYYELYQHFKQKHIFIHKHLITQFWSNFTIFIYITRLFDRKIDCLFELEGNFQLNCDEKLLSKIVVRGNIMNLVYVIPGDYYKYSAQTETLQETLRFCKMCHSHKSLSKKS